jgi:hypothetical protein
MRLFSFYPQASDVGETQFGPRCCRSTETVDGLGLVQEVKRVVEQLLSEWQLKRCAVNHNTSNRERIHHMQPQPQGLPPVETQHIT